MLKRLILGWIALVAILLPIAYAQQSSPASAPEKTAVLIKIDGAIGPSNADFIQQSIEKASKNHASMLILQINTPGGLGDAMRTIISSILDSPIPVISYVAPSGARAASAGTYIVYASHVAAMAPGTNIGAATPVTIPLPGEQDKSKTLDSEERKMLNDARAYIRSLAQLRGRNIDWAEKAVTQGESLSAAEALKLGVIDIVAPDVPFLLKELNGRKVVIHDQEQILDTQNIKVNTYAPNWRSQFLATITDPNIAYILLLIGLAGIFFEFFNPGFVLPGVVGVIALLLALYAFQLLPINYVGLALILLGITFMIAEAFIASFGILGIGGIIAFLFGSIMLMDTHTPGFQIALSLIISVTTLAAAFFLFVINIAIRSHRRPAASGGEQLIGKSSAVEMDAQGNARVRILGELWQVKSDQPLVNGEKVKVLRREGLILWVTPENQLKEKSS